MVIDYLILYFSCRSLHHSTNGAQFRFFDIYVMVELEQVGICGEHGGEPSSVKFFAEAGLDYVSCSPFRVPIARLAAAQVAD